MLACRLSAVPCLFTALHCKAHGVIMDSDFDSCHVDPPSARAQMARIMAGIAFASVFFAALYYAFNVISIIVKGR